MLRVKAVDVKVAYHVDRYLTAAGETVSGEVDGILSTVAELADGDVATLVLDTGAEIPVALFQVEADGADIETPSA